MSLPTVEPFVLSRTFRAPRALLWRVQTEAEHLQHWLSPEGFHTVHTALEFRVGGRYHYGLEGPGGVRMWGLQRFLEIEPEQRIVHLQSFSDEHGGLSRHPMAPTWPETMHVTATYADGDGGTLYTVSWAPHESDAVGIATFDAAREGMRAGFGGTFAKLEAYLLQLQA